MRWAAAVVVSLVLAHPAQGQRVRLGYVTAHSERQDTVERRLRGLVSAASLSSLHRPLARRPHPAGTPASRAVVTYLERTLRGFGFEVQRHEYQAWLSQPRRVQVELTAPARRVLSVREPVEPHDRSSGHPELGDGYIAYSASGDVTAPVVYANYGLPDDYAELERRGVRVADAIVLARYGRSHRAVKVFTAQEAGARAVILYSDPADDGFVKGTPWPDGYWRGEQMLQRGNAKLSWYFHGDPLTPGVGATRTAIRLDPATAPTLPRIPVVAISWGEARHVLSALGGVVAPAIFAGGIPNVTYRLGPGPATLRVTVDMNDGLRPIHNVVATLRGQSQPDRLVLLGGHHDAWTFGAVDPGTGTAALLEVARVLGRLARAGARPERSISIAFWDAEEFGLIGSTEHAEQFRTQLEEQLVLYVNTDMYMKGRFDPGGVPSLRDFVVDVARDVPAQPQGPRTVLDEWTAATAAARPAGSAAAAPDLKSLGSGADFVPFQDYLGVPTLSVEFIGANGYGFGTYHTNYDSRAYVEQVADPGFVQGVTMAQTLGTLVLRMANADVLPFRFVHYATRLRQAVDGINEALRAPIGGMVVVPPGRLSTAAARVLAAATGAERRVEARLTSGALTRSEARAISDQLARIEQVLVDDRGTPGREWYRHVFHGWNIYALYDGQPFPGLVDALRRGDAARVGVEVERVEAALDRMAVALDAVGNTSTGRSG